MLRCADGSYYVGITRVGLDRRIAEHSCGKFRKCYTFKRRPVELVWSEYFSSLRDAISCERRIKGWRRAKKEALIAGDWDAISRLSRTAKPPVSQRFTSP
jgi:predicted GIY-YIG superfamily endonuclease